MANQKKQTQLQSLIDEIEQSTNFAVVKFEKTSHITLEQLRKQLKKNDAKIKVIKNSLFEKAIHKLAQKSTELKTVTNKALPLKDNSAILKLGDEWNKGLATFYQFTQKEGSLSFKFGFLEKQLYQSDDLKKIAQLPSKEVLIAKVIGGMKSPLYGLNYALKFNMQKFVYILSQKSQQTS